MFEEESYIDDILHHRTNPDGPWIPFTLEALSLAHKIEREQARHWQGQYDIAAAKLKQIGEFANGY